MMSCEMTLEVPEAKPLSEVIRDACGGDKNLLFKIIDEQGELRPHVAVFIGNEHCKYLGGLAAAVEPTAEVSVYPALSGG